jgi:hypothetical protein
LEASSAAARAVLEGCTVFDQAARDGAVRPLTIWADVIDPDRKATALTLAGFFEEYGMRCGIISPCCLDPLRSGADLSWHYLALGPGMDPAELAEPFAAWLTREAQRPVAELLAPQNERSHRVRERIARERRAERG